MNPNSEHSTRGHQQGRQFICWFPTFGTGAPSPLGVKTEEAISEFEYALPWFRGIMQLKGKMDAIDQKWIDALRRFMGDGTGPVPTWQLPDGSIDAHRTIECVFGMYSIHPVAPVEYKG
jgi:hypothetical protein